MSGASVRIMVVDDHALFREGLVLLLKRRMDLQVVAEVSSGEEALARAQEVLPDLVLLDLNLPGMDGVETCRVLKRWSPELRVAILTMSDDLATLYEAIRAGACGYLVKDIDSEELCRSIDQICQDGGVLEPVLARRILAELQPGGRAATARGGGSGGPGSLSAREIQILELVASGRSNKEIASLLSISRFTVGNHVNNIFRKLGVNDRTQAAVKALNARILGSGSRAGPGGPLPPG